MAAEEDEASEDAFGEEGSDDGSEDEGEEGEEGEDESEDGSDWTYETEDSELSDEEFQSNVNGGWPVAPHGLPLAVALRRTAHLLFPARTVTPPPHHVRRSSGAARLAKPEEKSGRRLQGVDSDARRNVARRHVRLRQAESANSCAPNRSGEA